MHGFRLKKLCHRLYYVVGLITNVAALLDFLFSVSTVRLVQTKNPYPKKPTSSREEDGKQRIFQVNGKMAELPEDEIPKATRPSFFVNLAFNFSKRKIINSTAKGALKWYRKR